MRHPRATSVVLAAAVAVSMAVGSVTVAAAASAEDWTATQLTFDANRHIQPQVSGDRVVWLGADGTIYRVFTQKLGADASPVVVTTGDTTDANWPQVSGDRIVWQEDYEGEFNIYTQKLGVDASRVLVSADTDTYNIWPQVSGDRVAWYGATQLFTRKVGADATWTQLTNMEPVTDSVQVSGDRVVWTAHVDSYEQVFTQKVGVDPAPVQLTTGWDHLSPQVSGDRIVWLGWIGGYLQVFTQKIGADASPVQLTTLPLDNAAPQVSGDRIAWVNNERVFTRKMGVDAEPIQLSSGSAGTVKVSGDRVVWLESDGSYYQLIAQDVGSGDEPVQLTATGGGQQQVSGEYVTWVSDVGGFSQVFEAHAPLPVVAVPTTLRLSSASKVGVSYGSSNAITGSLTAGGAAAPGANIVLQTSTNGSTFSNSTTALTSATGSFSFNVKPTTRTWYRVLFAGSTNYLASGPTAAIYVTPKAYLTNPYAPTTVYRNRAFTTYGYLKPRHTSGSYPVRIYKYRYVSGVWKSYGYVTAKASNYSSYTKYTKALSLPYAGKWRLRTYAPADSGHAATWSSGYDNVTVK